MSTHAPAPSHSYDISPTTPVPGLRLNAMVTRRFLISYPVQPAALSAFLPPDAELSTWQGLAWVSACFVNIRRMRPCVVPNPLGIEFNYLIHRTRARVPYPDGARRESVLVLEANINNRLYAAMGQWLQGVRFHTRDIRLLEEPDRWRVRMCADDGALLFQADIAKDSIGDELPADARFPNLAAADKFLLNVSYGAEWHAQKRRLSLSAETHDVWRAQAGSCTTQRFAFLESLDQSLGTAAPQADHAITMTNVPHYFALRGTKEQL